MASVSERRVDSPRNPFVKRLVRLRERRQRDRSGMFLIEGARELQRALQAGVGVTEVAFAPELGGSEARAVVARARAEGIEVSELSAEAFERASQREGPDGVLAVARSWLGEPERLRLRPSPLLLVIDGVEKPGNLGALLRSADAVGADAVLACGEGTDPFNPNVVRASMGSLFALPVVVIDEAEARAFLARSGIRTVASTPEGARQYWDVDMRGPLALIVGAEHQGLGESWLRHAHEQVRIPMAGSADSLNVATSGALLLYEALRQRREEAATDESPAAAAGRD